LVSLSSHRDFLSVALSRHTRVIAAEIPDVLDVS
jgi:hypothetical protein